MSIHSESKKERELRKMSIQVTNYGVGFFYHGRAVFLPLSQGVLDSQMSELLPMWRFLLC